MAAPNFSRALRSDSRIYGTLVASTSSRWVSLLKGLPLDFVFIDTEHIPISRETLGWMCQAFAGAGLPPMVRIGEPDAIAACQAVDLGAAGVIAPYVETAEQVRELVGAVKFRPLKGQKLAAALAGENPLESALDDYVRRYNAGRSVIVNIESQPALGALDAILAVPGLDAILIGPHDLSCSLGHPEDYEHPVFEAAVVDIIRRARAAGIGAGIHSWMSADREAAWCRAGLNFLIHSSDLIATEKVIGSEIAAVRARMGDTVSRNDSGAATV
jgi:4-hydroxy-2-oxoheptanedioate aldolase